MPQGSDERRVRAARRFGRIGLAYTVVTLLLVPAWALWAGPPAAGIAVPLFTVFTVGLGLHVWRIREHVTALGRPPAPWFAAAMAAIALTVALLGLASGFPGFMWGLAAGVFLGDIVGGLRARWVAVWVVGAVAVVLAAGYPISAQAMQGTPISPWLLTGITAFYVGLMWIVDVERLWWLKAVTDLDVSRRTAAELAAARERLRLADDLHDILGHALEVVAFKSELASRLLRSDGERARTEMEEVQRVARSSLSEVRALVRERRPTDLAVELAGARAVLGSAGVTLTVSGDPDAVDPPARDVLGRVLREAMTNVLRHATPSRCAIAIETHDGGVVLRVENDGALPVNGADGTGLVALSRYLDEHAGRLDAGPGPDGTFRLSAALPGANR